MPQHTDSNFDALVEQYTDIVIDRMDREQLINYVYQDLIGYYSDMTEKGLIDHVAEMGDEELVESIYGNYPVQDLEGQYSLKKGESIVI